MRPYRFLTRSGPALLLALVFQAAYPVFADGTSFDFRRESAAPDARPSPATDPLPQDLPFPSGNPAGPRLIRMQPAQFNAFVASHAGQGRMLTGSELAAVHVSQPARAKSPVRKSSTSARAAKRDSVAVIDSAAMAVDTPAVDTAGPRALRELKAKDAARRDSLARTQGNRQDTLRIETRRFDSQEADTPDTLVIGQAREEGADNNERDARKADEEETTNWFVNLMVDFRDGRTGGGGGGWSGDELAAVIYVVVGVVVVGAFLIYGIQTLTELAVNPKDDPLFQEVGLRLSYSGHALRDGTGPDLYRDSYLAGLRYAIGFDRPGMDIGLAVEGGYIDVNLHEAGAPLHSFDFHGGYLVAGPMLRFGNYDPLSFSLEFLNGASNHESIGWISKSRMTLQARIGDHATFGGHLGAVFYDLQFLDGLAWRQGDFNRDLSLITGLDMGWEF